MQCEVKAVSTSEYEGFGEALVALWRGSGGVQTGDGVAACMNIGTGSEDLYECVVQFPTCVAST